jgi:hypothetical protein
MDAPEYTANDLTKYRIAQFEAQSLRAVRELLLGDKTALARLQAIENQIVALRSQMT